MREFIALSNETYKQTSKAFLKTGNEISAGLRPQIRELLKEVNKFGIDSTKELAKPSPNFEKLAQQAKELAFVLSNVAAVSPTLGKSLKKLITELEDLSEEYEKNIDQTDKFNKKITDISPKLGTALGGIVTNFQSLIKGGFWAFLLDRLFEVNSQITALQKNLGISSAQAQNLRAGFAQTAANANDLFINSTKIQQAFTDFSEVLGGAVENSGQILETFANLTGRFGLNNEQAAKLTSILGLQDKNTEQVLENTIKTINASRSSGKEFLNTKQIIQDISSVSFNVIATLGKSPDILAEAATRARELGLNLDQVEKIADSLLNFESSISAELTAELLTGKQLNLERARFLALNNDTKGLMEEINKQGINFNEFTKMGRIAQEGLAATLGMSRDSMAEMLFKQEQQALAQKASRGELDEQTLAQFKALDAQEKFNSAIEKAKTAFSDLVIVLSPILDVISKLAEWIGAGTDEVSKLGSAMGTVAEGTKQVERSMGKAVGYTLALIAASATYKTVSGAILAIEMQKTRQLKVQTITEALASAFRGGPVAALAGLAAAAVVGGAAILLTNQLTKTEDLMAPADGSPLLLKKGQAPIQGIPDDNVIFTTNNISSPINNNINSQMNNNEIINELKNLKQALAEYRSVPVVIENNIDGRQLNENTRRGARKGYFTTPSIYT
jgi:ABC-type transporter Mla subunit MlaD